MSRKQPGSPITSPEYVEEFQSSLPKDDESDEDTNELPRPKPMRRSITLEGLKFSDKLGGGKKARKRKNKTQKKRKSKKKKKINKNKKTRSKKQKE